MTTFTVHTENKEQLNALKAFMKALNIKFEIGKGKESQYDSDFVSKIQESEKHYQKGNFTTIQKENLKEFLGL